ncbi:MAG: hypothetical protein ACKOBW_11525 [Planctomycetota bacterium]
MSRLIGMVLRMLLLIGCLSAPACKLVSPMSWSNQQRSPVIFPQRPTADEMVRAINSNAAPIRQLDTDNASISTPGFPPLRANLALERPRKFRLRGQLLGPEVDVGSNDELFWMWIKHNAEPGIYYARHDDYATSPTRRMLPIDPSWLVEALGVIQLDPLATFQGPTAAGPERLELRTRVPSPQGDVTRVFIVHEKYGWVLEQRVLDERGQLLASAVSSQHQYYPDVGVSLAQKVELSVPAAEMAVTLNVRNYRINGLGQSPTLLWTMPTMDGVPLVDISRPPNGPANPAISNPALSNSAFSNPAFPNSGLANPAFPNPAFPNRGAVVMPEINPVRPGGPSATTASGQLRYRGFSERR